MFCIRCFHIIMDNLADLYPEARLMNECLPDLTDEHTQDIIQQLKGCGAQALSLLVSDDGDDVPDVE